MRLPIKRSKRKAFTLIELLVTITIIATLIGISTVYFTSASQKGRDAQRKNDLKNIKAALTLYFQANSSYPNALTGCSTNDYSCYSSYPSTSPTWIPGLSPKYIKTIPHDPLIVGFAPKYLAQIIIDELIKPAYAGGGGGPPGGGGPGGPPPTTNAQATAILNNSGQVSTINITSSGANYQQTPTVIITGGGGTGATAHVTGLDANGAILGIQIDNPGTNYTNSTQMTITFCGAGNGSPACPTGYNAANGSVTVCSIHTSSQYCYSNPTGDPSSYELWAQLENTNDPDSINSQTAACQDASPGGKYNFCIKPD